MVNGGFTISRAAGDGTETAIDRSGTDWHRDAAMNTAVAISYYYPDEVGTS
jgi:hypothetical protein